MLIAYLKAHVAEKYCNTIAERGVDASDDDGTDFLTSLGLPPLAPATSSTLAAGPKALKQALLSFK
jgi:hypothetical protein